MAVFLPFIAELGVLISSELVALGVSEGIAGAVGGYATNEVRKGVNQAASTAADTIANRVLGQDTKEELQGLATSSEVYGLFSDPKEFAKRRLEDRKRQDIINRELTQSYEPPKDDCNCDSIPMGIAVDSEVTTDSPNNVGNLIGSLIVEHSSELANAGIQDHLEGIIPTIDLPDPTATHQEIFEDLVRNDPEKYTTIQKLSNYYADKSLSKSEEFQEIYRKYTGKGFEPRNVVMSEDVENYLFYMYDEIGDLITLKQKKDAKTLPAVYGTFGGPQSPNNRLPEDVPDVCFLAHDAAYSVSYFHWEADMKLVSRLVQRRESWPQDKITQLNGIVIYFATLGASLAVVKGSITGDPSEKVIDDDVTDDLFPIAVPEAVNLPKEQYLEQRFQFYKGFSEGIKETELDSKILSSGGPRLRSIFESIKIEIL